MCKILSGNLFIDKFLLKFVYKYKYYCGIIGVIIEIKNFI